MKKREKENLIKGIESMLSAYYLYPKIAKKLATLIKDKFKAGAYDKENDPIEFANLITADLQSINNDLHLKLKYDPDDRIGKLKPKLEHRIELSRKSNFGFEEIRILEGNIGYLKLNKFENPIFSGDTLTATMNFLGNSDALIIDIMNNPGGNIAMGELMSSYFFKDRIHLNNFDWREEDMVYQTFTMPYVSGKQFINKDLYILISGNSASGAEEFAYNLKHLKRAVIIGEQSAGAANSGSHRSLGDFKLYVPNGHSINPITKSNWEGVGVTPHIKISKKDAISTAYLLALKKIHSSLKDESYLNILESNKTNSSINSKVDNWLRESNKAANIN